MAQEKADKTKSHRILALVGMPGSGKSTAAEYFKARGWAVLRFGQFTIDEIVRRGQVIDERNERFVREEFRRLHGPAAYAKMALPKIEEMTQGTDLIIDGLYSWSEYKLLREALGERLVILAITAARRIRHTRLLDRVERPLTKEEVERRDYSEIENLEKGGPIAIADYTVVNDGDFERLERDLDQAVLFLYGEEWEQGEGTSGI